MLDTSTATRALLLAQRYLLGWYSCRNPRADFLDLHSLIRQLSPQYAGFLLLLCIHPLQIIRQLRNGGFLFLDFPVLFQKLVEEHGVHGFVAHRFRFATTVQGDKLWSDLGHFLGDEAKRERAARINLLLVTEPDRPEAEDRLAGLGHRPDLIFVAPRGGEGPDLVVGIDVNRPAIGNRRVNIADPGGVVHASSAVHGEANTNIAVARDVLAGTITDGRVGVAGGVVVERAHAIGRVLRTGGVSTECALAIGRVEDADGVAVERVHAIGRVGEADGVAVERALAIGRVGEADGVAVERAHAIGRVGEAGGVAVERVHAIGRVGDADGVVPERIKPRGRVVVARRIGQKRRIANGRVAVARAIAIERAIAHGRVSLAGCVEIERPRPVGRIEISLGVARKGERASGRVFLGNCIV